MGHYTNCPDCGGTGEDGRFLCFRCKGKGKIYIPDCKNVFDNFFKNIFSPDDRHKPNDDNFFSNLFR